MAKKSTQNEPQTKLPALAAFGGRKLELKDLRLLKCSSGISSNLSLDALPKEINQQIKVQCRRAIEEQTLVYMLEFSLKALTDNGEDALSFEATFGLAYRFESLDGIDDEAAQAF